MFGIIYQSPQRIQEGKDPNPANTDTSYRIFPVWMTSPNLQLNYKLMKNIIIPSAFFEL